MRIVAMDFRPDGRSALVDHTAEDSLSAEGCTDGGEEHGQDGKRNEKRKSP